MRSAALIPPREMRLQLSLSVPTGRDLVFRAHRDDSSLNAVFVLVEGARKDVFLVLAGGIAPGGTILIAFQRKIVTKDVHF